MIKHFQPIKIKFKGKGPYICLLIPTEELITEVQKNSALFGKGHPLYKKMAHTKEDVILPAPLSSAAIHEPTSFSYVTYLLL